MEDPSLREKQEDELIQSTFDELINDYLHTKHRKRVEIITKAFNFARQAHKDIRRLSGEPYIMHPLAVAKIVCNEIGLGSTSICCALLHDVVEDTDYTVEDIENIFGKKIAQIVDGLTKIAGGIFGEHASAQAENFKKLLLTMSDDIRVILIKIADRLHNMRTLSAQAPSKQYKIAGETLYLYAPLANRLGLGKIKTELENLSFKYEHPDTYAEIEQKLQVTAKEREKVFADFTAPIKQTLDHMGLKYHILARVKSVYSIWNKMQTKNVPFEEIYDILAVRIIFEPKDMEEELTDCFNIYVGLSKIYKPHPDRIRDWVNHPKSNGYQALHVTLMHTNGQWIEVQIRSQRMDDIAEQGFAAHWKYKDGGGGEDEGELEKWLNTIKEILDDPQPDAMDFLDTIKLNLFAQEIFVFTPKGEIKTLPQNSTALDFAFSLHTEIGSHCIGAKVNHKLVPLSHKLQSGDQVEVLTSKSQRVQPEWVQIAATGKARNKIMTILRKDAKIIQKEGFMRISEFFKPDGVLLDDAILERIVQMHGLSTVEELLEAVGRKEITLTEQDRSALEQKSSGTSWLKYLNIFASKDKSKEAQASDAEPTEKKPKPINTKKVHKLTDTDFETVFHMAPCCQPIPGDAVMGFLEEDGSVSVHKLQCPQAARLKSSYGNRLIAIQWATTKNVSFTAGICLRGIDRMGLLNDVTQVISHQMNANIRKLTIESIDGIFEGRILLIVHDVEDIKDLCKALKQIDGIEYAGRE